MASLNDAFVTPSNVFGFDDLAYIISDTFDPSTGAGQEAPIGSIYIDRTSGFVYRKATAPDTGWVAFGDGTSGSIDVRYDGTPTPGAPHNIVNFTGGLVTVSDAGGGQVDIEVDADIDLGTNDGNTTIYIIDDTRGGKELSVETVVWLWGESSVSNNDWINVNGATSDTDSGYIMPFDGTIVFSTGHTEDANGNNKQINLYINSTNMGSLGTLTGPSEAQYVNNTANIDFDKGDKLRLRGNSSGGTVQDTIAVIGVKWRI